VADREEEFVYRGKPDFTLPGLLTHEGRQQIQGGDWAAVERALGDVLAAVTQLDEAGLPGTVRAGACSATLQRAIPALSGHRCPGRSPASQTASARRGAELFNF
jgi:Encapsulating protein for peroxidase